MTEEDEDDSGFSTKDSSSQHSKKPKIIDDIGRFVRRVLNSKVTERHNSDAFDQMVGATQAIMPDLQLYLVEGSNPGIHSDFSHAKQEIETIKALALLEKTTGNLHINPANYQTPQYGAFQPPEEYKPKNAPEEPEPPVSKEKIYGPENGNKEDKKEAHLPEEAYVPENGDYNHEKNLEEEVSEDKK